MTLDDFVKAFGEEFEDTPIEEFSATTKFKELDEWNSLTALAIISMIDDQLDIQITGAALRSSSTIEDLYNVVFEK